MDCPRCGTRLTRISLNGELQSVYCERCRFADVESDHTRASEGEETWDDALQRFRTANAEAEPEEDVDAASDADGQDSGVDSTSDADEETSNSNDEEDSGDDEEASDSDGGES